MKSLDKPRGCSDFRDSKQRHDLNNSRVSDMIETLAKKRYTVRVIHCEYICTFSLDFVCRPEVLQSEVDIQQRKWEFTRVKKAKSDHTKLFLILL